MKGRAFTACILWKWKDVPSQHASFGNERTCLHSMHPLEMKGRAFTACILWKWKDVPSQHASFGNERTCLHSMHPLEMKGRAFTAYILWSSGFVRIEILRLTDAKIRPGQTRMSHWRCDILKQNGPKTPVCVRRAFCLLFALDSPSISLMLTNIHSARMYAVQALIPAPLSNIPDSGVWDHPCRGKSKAIYHLREPKVTHAVKK